PDGHEGGRNQRGRADQRVRLQSLVAMVSRRASRRGRLVGAVLLVAGCANDVAGVGRAVRPEIEDDAVQAGPNNVLSAVVSARLSHADSATVSFRLDEAAATYESVTPAVRIVDGSVSMLPVLGPK